MRRQAHLKPVLMSWSGGKDSCLALYELQKAQQYKVTALLTTVTRDYERKASLEPDERFDLRNFERQRVRWASEF